MTDWMEEFIAWQEETAEAVLEDVCDLGKGIWEFAKWVANRLTFL